MAISFGSDNHSGVHPRIFEAMAAVNSGTSPSYGMDDISLRLHKQLKNLFACHDSFIVFNGTAANVLALNQVVRSFESIICTDISHLNVDECGAPEKFIGAKLIALPHTNGKLPLDRLSEALVRRGDQHSSQVRALSITQPTEYGTVYTLDELAQLRQFCTTNGLFLHIDGARLANACHFLDCEFKDILKFCDVASVGGAKNGLLTGELVVVQTSAVADNFKFYRKQAMQLPSKTRFLAAQFEAYFADSLWREIARQQCSQARYLAERILTLGVSARYPVESNAVFCLLPKAVIKPLREDFFFYVWNELTYECRLMTSFSTRKEDIDEFTQKLEILLKNRG